MTLSFEQTKDLIQRVLSDDPNTARDRLHFVLAGIGGSVPEFYGGIVKHGPDMGLTSEQWFELLSRLPNRLLRSQLPLDRILSENQRLKLPPPSG